MLGWTPKDLTTATNQVLGASLSNQPLGKTFNINASGATRALLVAIKASSVAGTVTVQLQHGVDSGTFANVTGKSVALSNGWNYIRIHHNATGDAALLPLLGVGRLVVTTDGSGAATIESLVMFQEL